MWGSLEGQEKENSIQGIIGKVNRADHFCDLVARFFKVNKKVGGLK